MPPWFPVVLQIVIPVLAVVVTAIVNLTIKFAPSRDEAVQKLKDLMIRAIQWIANLALLGSLTYSIFSSEPLTRMAVFTIALGVAGLMCQVYIFFINRMKNQIYGHIRHAYNCINTLNENIGTIDKNKE